MFSSEEEEIISSFGPNNIIIFVSFFIYNETVVDLI